MHRGIGSEIVDLGAYRKLRLLRRYVPGGPWRARGA
jgi:hypothetical protein